MSLDKKLALLRKREGLTQAEVAEKLDVSRQAISRWESGESKPSTKNIQTLCALYNVQMDALLNDSEDELSVAVPVDVAEKKSPERGEEKEEKRRIKFLAIGAVVLAVLICVLVWHGNRQKEDGVDLHSIQGEDIVLSVEPDFNLNWE